jgi:hypothetical protein
VDILVHWSFIPFIQILKNIMTGLNDNFLLADDSMEAGTTPTVVVNAFKDTPAGGDLELREDVDLIAATEGLEVQLRDLDLLKQSIQSQGGMSQSIALEAQALMPDFISDARPIGFFTKMPSRTQLTVALEEVEEKEKSTLRKIWDFIIGLLKRIAKAIVQFFTGIDVAAREEAAKKAEKILKNKQNIDFANDVVKKLSSAQLAIIAAIENDKEFTTTYKANVDHDRNFTIPSRWSSDRETDATNNIISEMEKGIARLNSSIAEATAMDETERNAPLVNTLQNGVSINGSENIEYLKDFIKGSGNDKRAEALIKDAEKLQQSGGRQEVISCMKKMVATMAKQFSMEHKVVATYMALHKAVIEVNDKIYEGV